MKLDRHAEILRIIQENEIETQGELTEKLAEAGFVTTQATVSRDIRELKLTKELSESGRSRYVSSASRNDGRSPVKQRMLAEAVVSVEKAGNIVVIKTISGMAMAAAAALDELKPEGIVGCIAGDDTIFAAVIPGKEDAVVSELRKVIS